MRRTIGHLRIITIFNLSVMHTGNKFHREVLSLGASGFRAGAYSGPVQAPPRCKYVTKKHRQA